MRECVKNDDSGASLFRHCSYGVNDLNKAVFAFDLVAPSSVAN